MPTSSALRSGVKNYARYLNVLAGTEPYVAPAVNSYDLLQTEILTGSQASVVFSSLGAYSSDYQSLQLRMTVRTDRANTGDILGMTFNSDTTDANYAYHWLAGSGSAVNSGGESLRPYAATYINAGSEPANAFSGVVTDLLDPFSTSKYLTARSFFSGAYDRQVVLSSLLWENTNSLTTITIAPIIGANWVSGCRFSLYGRKAA